MRLVCPNCGAEYEVPDDVIPPGGRDVQCSNCGIAWFQAAAGEEDDPVDEDVADADTFEPEDEAPEDWSEPQGGRNRNLPPEVADILREEAELEARLRAAEAAAGLESQPDLGLDDLPDLSDLNDPEPAEPDTPEPRPVPGPPPAGAMVSAAPEAVDDASRERRRGGVARRMTLPDVEEINSTLSASSDGLTHGLPDDADHADGDSDPVSRGGFLRGFSVSLVIVALLLLVYANAPAIARLVPQSDPALSAFVASVDQARLWLDNRFRTLLP